MCSSDLARQERLRNKSLTERGPLIYQLESQISLRRKYLSLLGGLKENGGDRILQELEEQKQEVDENIKTLREEISRVSGNRREKLEEQLNIMEGQRHALVKRFDALFDPLREVVLAISEEEEEMWKAEDLLRRTGEEIASLIGTVDSQGLLEIKTKERERLLLIGSQNVIDGEDYDAKVRQLNDEIAG